MLPRPPAQALPAGAAAAAPAMDVRLYPSAPAVGARPGAEPAGLAHLDYYHCGKVGRGRESRARVWGRSHLAAADAATFGGSHGGHTHTTAPSMGTCRSHRYPGGHTHAPSCRSQAEVSPTATRTTTR